MRALSMLMLLALIAMPARSESIDEVLQRSQLQRLRELPLAAADDVRVATVQRSFERLRVAMDIDAPVELRVISGSVVAECLLGRIVVANQSLGDLPEGERLFVLAHELGHIAHGHWQQVGTLFRAHIPGAVVQDQTDRAAPVLGPKASALMHSHEFAADAFALAALTRLGHGAESAMATFLRNGVQHDTATHPGTRKRVAHLRTLQQ